ncbi:MAG: hypothetical protein WCT10_04740 [Patescibacteria group bacterium]|jgi:hypothetical protein
MATKAPRHPHTYTLDLFDLALDRLPPTFAGEAKDKYRERLAYFRAHPEVGYDEIMKTIAALGKESWPHRKAYEDLYAVYGRPSEESHLLDNLDQAVRQKFETFIHEGGKINHIESAKSADDLHQASPFERYFAPEEKFAIQQALLLAREAARKEINELVVGKKKYDYDRLVEQYRGLRQRLEGQVVELKNLAEVSEKWRPDIMDKVRLLEEGWSVVESGISEQVVASELDYWKGVLQTFLHA